MKKSRFSDQQILDILAEGEAGAIQIKELCRKHGISSATYYNWKRKYGGMEINELRRLQELERENSELKQIVAEQSVDIRGLKAALRKKY